MARDVLVVGSGGREHALVRPSDAARTWAGSSALPAMPASAEEAELVPSAVDDLEGLAAFAARREFDLTVVGPEVPLVAGLADLFRARGLPSSARRRRRPAGGFQSLRQGGDGRGRCPHAAVRRVHRLRRRRRLRAGGRRAHRGQGRRPGRRQGGDCGRTSAEAAEAALRECFLEDRFGEAGRTVLVEECLVGEEVSPAGPGQRTSQRPPPGPRPGLQAHLRR